MLGFCKNNAVHQPFFFFLGFYFILFFHMGSRGWSYPILAPLALTVLWV